MDTFMELLFDGYGIRDTKKFCPEEEQGIRTRRGNFKKTLHKKQYIQIIRLLDDANMMTEKMSVLNFAQGIRFGIQLMTEVYSDTPAG